MSPRLMLLSPREAPVRLIRLLSDGAALVMSDKGQLMLREQVVKDTCPVCFQSLPALELDRNGRQPVRVSS